MADFRPEFDWDQNADRHSALTDPVVTVRQLPRFGIGKDYSRIDNALVFTTHKGAHEVFLPPHRPPRSALRRYSAVYEVNMGVQAFSTSLLLPSDDDAFEFAADLETTWQVTAPERFVTSGEWDVPALLTRRFEEMMRPVGRRFPIDRAADAEHGVYQEVAASAPPGQEIGLRVSWNVRLKPDADAIAHRRALRSLRYSNEHLDPSHELVLREERLTAQREIARAEHEHRLAMLRSGHEAELRKAEDETVRFYQELLRDRGITAWALHLAHNAEERQTVLRNLREEQAKLIQKQAEVALQVLKADGLEDYQRAGAHKTALRALEGILSPGLVDGAGSRGVPDSPATGVPVALHKPVDAAGGGPAEQR